MPAATDLKFVLANAGGSMGTTVVQSAENSVWPDVMPTERVSGARGTKRLYGAVLSEDVYPLVGARVGFAGWPGDAAIDMLLTGAGVDPSLAWTKQSYSYQPYKSVVASAGLYDLVLLGNIAIAASGASAIEVDSATSLTGIPAGTPVFVTTSLVEDDERPVGGFFATPSSATQLTLDRALPSAVSAGRCFQVVRKGGVSPVSAAKTTASASAGATSVVVGSLLAATSGTPTAAAIGSAGAYAPRFLPGDVVVVQHTNGTTREWKTVASINYATKSVAFTSALANAYPSGSIISSALSLGDLQARVSAQPFSLQTWSRTWADALPAGALAPSATYRGTPLCNNAGTITERWALVFRSDSIFDLIGERLGQIATGNVGTGFLPLNPMTNEPFFELQASLWSSGWLPGNAVRFNTVGAHGAFDAHRVVAAGSAASTLTSAPMFLSGDVNA